MGIYPHFSLCGSHKRRCSRNKKRVIDHNDDDDDDECCNTRSTTEKHECKTKSHARGFFFFFFFVFVFFVFVFFFCLLFRIVLAKRITRSDVVLKAIQEPEPETSASSSSSSSSSTSIRDVKWKMKDMRKQMGENEDLDVLMSGLRGTNIDQSDFAEQGVR